LLPRGMGVESEGTATRPGGEEGGEDKRPRGSGLGYFN
jgi:hypothetical protein